MRSYQIHWHSPTGAVGGVSTIITSKTHEQARVDYMLDHPGRIVDEVKDVQEVVLRKRKKGKK